MKRLVCWAVPLLALAGAAEARPPVDPTGAYVVVDKVVLEPSEGSPERAQIWGTFVLAADRRGFTYHAPQYVKDGSRQIGMIDTVQYRTTYGQKLFGPVGQTGCAEKGPKAAPSVVYIVG